MSEEQHPPQEAPPHPYSEAARGAAQIQSETQMLAEAYDRGLRGIESQAAHQQNQALIAELLARQAYRADTGQQYLSPVRTRVETPAPRPPPTPEPVESRPRLVVHGEDVPWPAPQAEPEEDAGTTQMLDEAETLFQVRERAMRGGYRTPAEWKRLQDAEDALVERQRWREATGQRLITDGICRPRP